MGNVSNIPAQLQLFIQDEKEKILNDCLLPEIGFRAVASREEVHLGHSETVIKFKRGYLTPSTTPTTSNALFGDLDNGMTSGQRLAEQYSMTMQAFNGTLDLRKTDNVMKLIQDYENNAIELARMAVLSMDIVASKALYAPYMSGETFVNTTATSTVSMAVDDVTGFEFTMVNGVPTPVSASNAMNITINPTISQGQVQAGTGTANTVVGVTVDSTNVSKAAAFGARSGVLTLGTARAQTAGDIVVTTDKPRKVRPYASGSERSTDLAIQAGDLLTMRQIRRAVREARLNGVPMINGKYNFYVDPTGIDELFLDSEWQILMRGNYNYKEYRDARLYEVNEVRVITNNVIPTQASGGSGALATPTLHRAMLVGADALIEGCFPDLDKLSSFTGGDDSLRLHDLKVIDGISFVDRSPLDRLGLVMAQSWLYIGAFVAPTDSLITSTVFPTATSARYKRAVEVIYSE